MSLQSNAQGTDAILGIAAEDLLRWRSPAMRTRIHNRSRSYHRAVLDMDGMYDPDAMDGAMLGDWIRTVLSINRHRRGQSNTKRYPSSS